MSELDENEVTGASLLEILDELTDRIQNAKAMPLSASVLVNQSELLDLLETARAIVPQQIVDADSVLQDASAVTIQARSDADAIVAEARRKAESIVAEAKAHAEQLVAKDSITVAAQREGAKIVDEATQKASKVKRGADQYSDSALEKLARHLGEVQDQIDSIQEQISAGRSVLAQRANQSGRAVCDGAGRGAHRKPRKGE